MNVEIGGIECLTGGRGRGILFNDDILDVRELWVLNEIIFG